jgi:hypothetical protein
MIKLSTHRLYCHKNDCKKYIMYKIKDDNMSYYAITKYGTFDIRNQVWYCKKHNGCKK